MVLGPVSAPRPFFPLAVTAPDGTAATYAYYIVNTITVDNRNLLALTNVKDANNRIVQQFSNSLGQLALVREVTGDGSGGSPYVGDADTRYYYDLVGNLVKVKQSSASNADPATWLAQTTMAYDGFGRKTGMSDPDMGNWTYAYDAAGNLTRQKDAKNQAICFRYDGLNRLAIKAQDSTPADDCPASLPTSGGYHLASYTYDTAVNGQGKVAQIAWGSTPTQNKDIFYYDTLGRMNKQDRYLDGRLYTMRTSSFDALHRPLTVVYPDNETVTYAYDREGENSLTVVTNQLVTNQLVTNVRYNARGQMTYLDRYNVADTTYLYHPQTDLSGGGLGDSNFRLKTIQHGGAGSGDTWPDFTYEYDRVGNISKMITLNSAGTDTQSFGYDHLHRLITASAAGGVANYNHNYAYDKLGNIDYRVDSGNTLDYIYGAKPHAVTAVNASSGPNMSFAYDANGNMTSRNDETGNYIQGFDVENRLISVTSGGDVTTFAYDAAGIRVKTVQPNRAIVYTPFPQYEEELRPLPTLTLTANGQNNLMLPPNTAFTLAWSSSDSNACTASGSWSGSKALNGSQSVSGFSSGSRTYTLTCSNAFGSASAAVTVSIIPPPPSVTITANGWATRLVLPPHANFTLAWSSSEAQTCVASGAWSGSKTTSGSQQMSGFAGGFRDYILTCSNANGSTSRSVRVSVEMFDPCYGVICPESMSDGSAVILTAPENGGQQAILIQRSVYHIAGQTIATRVSGDPVSGNNGLTYFYNDHLGSNTALRKPDGSRVSTYYLPFGNYRGTAPNQTITDRDFTGQRENMELGLLYYNARYYVRGLGRFASADTIVPDPMSPQSLNRYTYVLNSPLNFSDPSGHRPSDGCDYEGCDLPNGFDPDSTWQTPDVTLLPWDPVAAAAQDYNPITESVIPATIGLFGIAAAPAAIEYVAVEVAWPGLVKLGSSISSWLCLNDGNCGNELEIAQKKLDYLLNSQGKAGGFERLGYTSENVGTLQRTLNSIGQQIDISVAGELTEFGIKYRQSAEILGPNGVIGRINTVWQIDNGSTALRFVTGWAEPFK